MNKDKFHYRQSVAFINREIELRDLRTFIDKEPSEILFIHGPKSSGKTTLLYKFLEKIQEEQKLNVKFMDLRETFTNFYDDFLKTFFSIEPEGEKKESRSSNINIGFFKIDASVEKKILEKRVDPFKVMKAEFVKLTEKGIKPVLIIDELQALDRIYIDNAKDRQLITALFNFFVAMTKQAHLAHIIIASSDGYFLNTVYNDSKLKKCSRFYKVDYLTQKDVIEWLLNLEKYSKINAFRLTEEDAGKIWDAVGGSMWEIQDILTDLFNRPIDEVLATYKKRILGMISYYITQKDRKKREKVLRRFVTNECLWAKDTDEKDADTLRDMVSNNILYFDPTEAVYYPQGKSYWWGIKLYFENIKK